MDPLTHWIDLTHLDSLQYSISGARILRATNARASVNKISIRDHRGKGDLSVRDRSLGGNFWLTTTHHPYYQSKVTYYDHIVLEKLSPYGFDLIFERFSTF